MSTDALQTTCRNCGTILQGPYCHVCGQNGHDPLRSFAHALEEVFESFWHLDGRVFRTLRDLLVPGRLAIAYLDGRRARYLPPLRLFVMLTLLTFFVGKLTLHTTSPGDTGDSRPLRIGINLDFAGIDKAATPAQVLEAHAQEVREIEAGQNTLPGTAWMTPVFKTFVRARADRSALVRLRALHASEADIALLPIQDERDSPPPGARAATPGLLQRWQDDHSARLRENISLIDRDPDASIRMIMGALPGALFVLVPVFALFLKLLYFRSGMGYLQHLTVALYSHSAMLIALLCAFLMVGLYTLAPWAGIAVGVGVSVILGVVIPLYLFLMQKKVYAQGWVVTSIKYAMLGMLYLLLMSLTLAYATIAGLVA